MFPHLTPSHPCSHAQCENDLGQQIDNSTNLLRKIANLYAERLLSDIIFEVGGKEFPAHRVILCASSDVFQVMLMDPSWSESHQTRIILQEEQYCIDVFEDFLKYLYTGKLHINHHNALPMLTLADKYNVKDLVQLCLDYMALHVMTASKHNQLISWLQYTNACGHQCVYSICHDFILWNFEMVSKMTDFGMLETEMLIRFLSQSDVVIHDELALFHCVTKWIEIQEQRLETLLEDSLADFSLLVTEVMSHIRFPMMTPRQLASLLLHKLTSQFKDFFVEKMRIAMSFHSNRISDRNAEQALFLPRLYTTETWSVSLSIDNFSTFPVNGVRTLMFSTPGSLAECESIPTYDWTVDVYPKGIWFKKCYLIVWQGSLEIPEWVSKTVRLSLTLKDTTEEAHVSLGILFCGSQDGVEHIRKVVKKTCIFTADARMMNISDLVSFEELNTLRSPFLTGPTQNCLRLHVVIMPYKFS